MHLYPILLLISLSIVGVFSTPSSSHVHTSKLDTFQPDLSFSNLPQPFYDSKLENSVLQQSLPGFNSGTYKLPQPSYSDPHSISPLYISPLLQSGQNLLAQDLSRVTSLIPGVPEAGYSAFITVDAASGTHLHFWFIPKENCEHWRQEPTTLWLQDQGIDISIFRALGNEESLREVLNTIPRVGDRVKFRENLNLYLEDLKRGHDDNNSCASTSSVTYLNLTSLPEDGTYFSELDSLVNFNNPSTSATQISSDTLIQNPSTHHDTPSFTPNEENVSTPRQSRTTSSSSTVDLTPSTSTDFPSGFVLNILQASFQGRTILEKGKAGALEPTDRKRLSNIIIQHILENCPNRRLCADQFCYLGSQIIQIFPEEFLSLYYVRYIQSSNSGNKKSAAGSLYDSYTTIRNKLKIEGHIKTQGKSKKRRNTSLSPQPSCSKDANVEDIEDQYINCEDLEYLRSSVYPWEVVVAKWKGTCNLRHKKLTGKSKAEGDSNLVGQYMNEFPALKQPNGFQLLLEDFNILYPHKSDFFFSKIAITKDHLINIAKKKVANSSKGSAINGIKSCLALIEEDHFDRSDEDLARSLAAILLLPYMIAIPNIDSGGYGLSTLRGALQENLVLFNVTEEGHMEKFDHGLTRYMNILMVDNAGVGFSHTQDPNYIVTDYNFIAEELYAVLTQIFLLFPELKRSVYIGGTSAGASKVTATAELVLNRDPEVVRLAGVIIGDGVTDLETDLSLQAEYLHNLGMIEKKVVRNVTNILEDGHALKNTGNKFEADGIFFDQYVDEINRHIGYKDKDLQDVLRAFRFRDHWLDFLEQDEIREKLHVGRLPFVLTDPKAAGFLSGSPSKTNGEILEIILNRRVPVMRYEGQYDALLTYQSTIASMRNLNWYGQACLQSEQFRRSQIWFEGKLFGYQRKCYNLWEVLALRAAHVVQLAVARPFWAFVWDWVKERERDAGKLPQ